MLTWLLTLHVLLDTILWVSDNTATSPHTIAKQSQPWLPISEDSWEAGSGAHDAHKLPLLPVAPKGVQLWNPAP